MTILAACRRLLRHVMDVSGLRQCEWFSRSALTRLSLSFSLSCCAGVSPLENSNDDVDSPFEVSSQSSEE